MGVLCAQGTGTRPAPLTFFIAVGKVAQIRRVGRVLALSTTRYPKHLSWVYKVSGLGHIAWIAS